MLVSRPNQRSADRRSGLAAVRHRARGGSPCRSPLFPVLDAQQPKIGCRLRDVPVIWAARLGHLRRPAAVAGARPWPAVRCSACDTDSGHPRNRRAGGVPLHRARPGSRPRRQPPSPRPARHPLAMDFADLRPRRGPARPLPVARLPRRLPLRFRLGRSEAAPSSDPIGSPPRPAGRRGWPPVKSDLVAVSPLVHGAGNPVGVAPGRGSAAGFGRQVASRRWSERRIACDFLEFDDLGQGRSWSRRCPAFALDGLFA